MLPPPGEGPEPTRPEYLLLQATHPLPVGPLPRLQGALRLHLGTAQAIHFLLQLQPLLIHLQPRWAVVLLQCCHLGLQEGPRVRPLAVGCQAPPWGGSLRAPWGKAGDVGETLVFLPPPSPPGLQILGQGS